jgi:hypothetical protein
MLSKKYTFKNVVNWETISIFAVNYTGDFGEVEEYL